MSFTIHGIGVSGGIAIGHAQLVSHAQLEVAHYDISKARVTDEKARFDAAVVTARAELASLGEHIPIGAPAEFEAFLNVHLMILDDPTLSEMPKQLIESLQCNAEWALKLQMDALIEQFESIEDGYLRDRKTDVIQVVERILKVLMGRPGQVLARNAPEENSILVAHDLSPADVIQFKSHRFASFVTDLGGATSHTAIIARSLNIPSVVALHHARTLIRENEVLIIDGSSGVVIVNPDKTVLAEYKLRQEQWGLERLKLKRLKKTRTTTLDGTSVELHANIELYRRQITLPEVGLEGQERLRAARVLVVGTGGLGSPVALYLAAAGVGTLGLVDFDRVDATNLHRQVLHGTASVGQLKVDSARARLSDLNPHVRLVTYDTALTSANAMQVVSDYDLVIDGTDNFPTRYLLSDACVLQGKPNVYGSVQRFEGGEIGRAGTCFNTQRMAHAHDPARAARHFGNSVGAEGLDDLVECALHGR